MNTKGNKGKTRKHIQNTLNNKVAYKNQTIQCSASIKPLQRSYRIESMDSDTDRVVASLEEIIKNYNT